VPLSSPDKALAVAEAFVTGDHTRFEEVKALLSPRTAKEHELMAPNKTDSTIATPAANAQLKHSQGGVTTRDDVTDLGVPMLAGSPTEPTGPEDALGAGPKRGDYRGRIGPDNYQPHQVEAVADAKEGDPQVRVVAQRPLADDIGDAAGLKGGVETGK
jgi:hypothetical protein